MSTVENVPLLDPRRANSLLEGELRAAFDGVLASGRFILGNEVEAFERSCARYLGVEHAIGVSSGTDALLVSLMALGIGAGDEVICPAYTFFGTAGSIWRTGARPVFVDIRPRCFNLNPQEVARKISEKTRAIIPVHLFGQCAHMDPVIDLARAKGIPVIEDAAQAIGAEYQGKHAGSLGDIGCFSFFPSKNLGGFGDGGLVTSHDETLADRIRALRNHGGIAAYDHQEVGGNFRLDALQAALLHVKLEYVDHYAKGRQKNAALYTKLFMEAGVGAPARADKPCADWCPQSEEAKQAQLSLPVACQSNHVFNQYVVRVHGKGQRDRLYAQLQTRNIGCAIYYPKPLHLLTCFSSLRHREGDFPIAEQASLEALALPIFSELSESEIHHVVEQVVKLLREAEEKG